MTADTILAAFERNEANKIRPDVRHFAGCYSLIFGLIGTPSRMVEFGVQRGGSIRAWLELFPGVLVLGVDDDKNIPRAMGGNSYTSVGPQDDPVLVPLLKDVVKDEPYDLIIDDCSHNVTLTLRTLALCWPLLRAGGAYVIEDVPAAVYWPVYNSDGERNDWYAWLADLSKEQNTEAWKDEEHGGIRPEFTHKNVPRAALVLQWRGMLAMIKGE